MDENLWHAVKAIFRRKFTHLNAYITPKKVLINDLSINVKKQKKKKHLYPENRKVGMISNSFHDRKILIPKPDKGIVKRKNKPTCLMKTDAKVPNKILANWILQHIKRKIQHVK